MELLIHTQIHRTAPKLRVLAQNAYTSAADITQCASRLPPALRAGKEPRFGECFCSSPAQETRDHQSRRYRVALRLSRLATKARKL